MIRSAAQAAKSVSQTQRIQRQTQRTRPAMRLAALLLLAQATALRGRRRWRGGSSVTTPEPQREGWTFSTRDLFSEEETPDIKKWTFSTRDLLSRRKPKKVLMLMSDTGGGHRASANALKQALLARYNVQVDLLDIWTAAGVFPWSSSPRAYSYMGKRPMIWRAFFYGANSAF